MSAQSLTATGTFNVQVNFTSVCSVNAGALAPVFNYTSGGAAAAFATAQSFTVNYTNSVPNTLSLDAGGTGYTALIRLLPERTQTQHPTLVYSLLSPAVRAIAA